MNNKFDELAKSLAQSVTRRGALKKFGLGLASVALASLGLANKAEAAGKDCDKFCSHHCIGKYWVGAIGTSSFRPWLRSC